MEMISPNYQWYRLDNAAIIFPAVTSKKITTLFRLSCDLNEPVDTHLLQAALEKILIRFPYFHVSLRRGLFWYYFETNPNTPRVVPDTNIPCSRLAIKAKGVFPFRVVYYKKRIAVEFSHAITDGNGALIFLKSLVAKYLELKGAKVSPGKGIFLDSETPDEEESEDAYKKIFKDNLPFPILHKKAYHIPYHKAGWHFYYVTTGILPIKPLLELAHQYKVTLTTYIAAVLFEAIQDLMIDLNQNRIKKHYNTIRVMIPIDLRKIYPTRTLKNFTLFIAPGIDPRLGIFSFDDIIKAIDLYMKMEINDKNIVQQLSRNVKGANLIKFLPLFLKNLILNYFYSLFGENTFTTSFSNLGVVELPDDMAEHITRFEFYPPPSSTIGINCSSLSYKDKFYISFGRLGREAEVEKRFFRKLVKSGVPVKIEANNFI